MTLVLLVKAIVLSLLVLISANSRKQGGVVGLSPAESQCPVLYLLNVEPYPYDGKSSVPVWDKGLSVIPAGHLAVEQINNRTDILPGFNLTLINIDSEPCGIQVISKGITNTFRELVNPELQRCIVGVVGLFCSSMTGVISPVVSHPSIGGFAHIAASTSPIHRGRNTSSNALFHIIGSSSVFNEATFALMNKFNWQRISLVHNSVRLYQSSTASDFMDKIHSDPDKKLIAHVSLPNSHTKVFNAVSGEDARISYWTVTYEQSAHLLCEAFSKDLLWPGYVYILHEPSLDKILQTKTSCSKDELNRALEGVFMLQYRLFVDDDDELFSGWKYGEFRKEYADELQKFANVTREHLEESVYANSLYDQVWAFALALNNTLFPEQSQISNSLLSKGYKVGSVGQLISSSLKRELRRVSFQGASGRMIHFGEQQESPSYVDIFQIQNGTQKLIGIFDPFSGNITFKERVPTDIPSDTFDEKRILLPIWLGVCLLIAQVVLFALITTNLVLVILWRREREIKASSPILSLLMMVGCFFLFVQSFILVLYKMAEIESTGFLHTLCTLKVWLSIGKELIFATMLMRLLRVYRIFCTSPLSIMSNYWVDKYLLLYVILLCLGKVSLLIVWSGVDHIRPVIKRKYVYGPDTGLPYYETTLHCSCSSVVVWVLVTKLYSALLILMVVHLAIQTRHVKKAVYKDTKKVNVFIFLVIVSITLTIPLWVIFLGKGIEVAATVSEWLSLYTIPLLCQVCLFVPKTLPVIVRKLKLRLNIILVKTS